MEDFEKYMNPDVEQKILARFLVNNDDINLYPDLKEEHFLFEQDATLFQKMLIANEKNEPFVLRNMANTPEEETYVKGLIETMPFGGVSKYVKMLIESSDKYNALTKAKEIIELAQNDSSVDVFGKLSEIATRDITEKVDDSPHAMLCALQNKMNNGEALGITCGIIGLDENINRFQKGRLYIVGARSGMGKSALMCSFVNHMEKTVKVGIISLEMKSTELKQRIACIRGNIPHWKIEKGKCQQEFDAYAESLTSIQNLIVSDKGGLNRNQVASVIRQMVKRAKCQIVFIDHIGLIQTDDRGNLAHEVGKITAQMKTLSKELDIPVVCLCQINRGVEKETSKKPKMSDLRDSGRIEEDADCIILLYRDGYYATKEIPVENVEYIVAKCRNGKRGVVNGTFTGELMKFE